MMNALVQDTRHAARLLARSPAFTAVAIVTLALGIGANSAMFSVIDAVLLRPLPFERAEELYVVQGTHQGARREYNTSADFDYWRTRNRVFTHMAAMWWEGSNITTPTGPEHLPGVAVSEDFFALFAVRPILGRTFLASEHRAGQDRVVVLSHGLWRRRFGGNPSVIGTSLLLDDEPNTIVGVAPAGFVFPDEAAFWRPLTLTDSAPVLRVVARLRPDVQLTQAQAEMTGLARQLEQRYPDNRGWGVELVSLQDKAVEHVSLTLFALWGAVGCVLLIACANIGILLLSRGIRRAPELAVRAALGAGRGRLVRQMLTESVLLTTLGGIGGLLVAIWGISALRALAPASTPRLQDVGLDLRVLLFTAAVALGTGIFVGIVPTLRIMRPDLQSPLSDGVRSATRSVRQGSLMRALVVGQVAACLVLLIGAGLMIRTLERLQTVNLGFNADRLLSFYVGLPEARYPERAQSIAFFRELLERVRALPGVRGATAVNALYVHWNEAIVVPVFIEGRPAPDGSRPPDIHIRIVDPDFHQVLQIPIARGRAFTAKGGADALPQAVINQAMARRYFAGEDPIGRRISFTGRLDGRIWHEVIGVAGDVKQSGLDADASPEVQVSYAHTAIGQMAILVRSAADPGALAPTIRAQVQALDPNLPLTYIQTMDEVLATSMATRRFTMRLLAGFAGVALILAAVGLYGVMATAVSERTREIAVRLALGASPSRVVRMVIGRIVLLAVVGATIGAVVAIGATRYLEPLLFGVTRTDPATYLATAALLISVTLASACLPARRVTRVDPVATLRAE